MNLCRLELKEKELKNSHIIPKFAFDYMKSTGSKYLRNIENPNKRHQDGTKQYLLCNNCEQLFSKRERWFANNIFFPYLDNKKTEFEYDDNLSYFIISMLWRVLVNQMGNPTFKARPELSFLDDVEIEWRDFLLNLKFPNKYNNLNIFITERVLNNDSNLINSDFYFTRLIDATIVHNESFSKIAIYAKFLRFIFWVPVKGYHYLNPTTNINLNKGKIRQPQILDDSFMVSFFYNRIKMIDNAMSPNDEQTKKMWDEVLKNEDEFWNSDAGKSMLNDFNNASK